MLLPVDFGKALAGGQTPASEGSTLGRSTENSYQMQEVVLQILQGEADDLQSDLIMKLCNRASQNFEHAALACSIGTTINV